MATNSAATRDEAQGEPAVNACALARFKLFINALDAERIDRLGEVFTTDVVFKDPFHEVRGLENLQTYYRSMYENLNSIRFDFDDDIGDLPEAAVPWRMFYQHRKIAGGSALELDGISTLRFEREKVAYQRDYFDAGALLYEHLPAVGWMVQQVKKRV